MLLLLFLFKVTLNGRHQVQASTLAGDHPPNLIGNVRSACTPTLLAARYAIDALPPGMNQMNLDLDTLMSQVRTARIFLLIGSVSSVAASTLLDALNAIDAVSPGCLLSPALPPDETPPCYCLSL